MNLNEKEIGRRNDKRSEKTDERNMSKYANPEKLLVEGTVATFLTAIIAGCGSAPATNEDAGSDGRTRLQNVSEDSGTTEGVDVEEDFHSDLDEDSVETDVVDEDIVEEDTLTDVDGDTVPDVEEDVTTDTEEDDVFGDTSEDITVDTEDDVSYDTIEDTSVDPGFDSVDTVDEDTGTYDTAGDTGGFDGVDTVDEDTGGYDTVEDTSGDAGTTDTAGDPGMDTGMDTVSDLIEDTCEEDIVSDLTTDTGADTTLDVEEEDMGGSDTVVFDVPDEDVVDEFDVSSDLTEEVGPGGYCTAFDDSLTSWIEDGDHVDVGGIRVIYNGMVGSEGSFDIECAGTTIRSDIRVSLSEHKVLDVLEEDMRVEIIGHAVETHGTTSTVIVTQMRTPDEGGSDVIGDGGGSVVCSASDQIRTIWINNGSTAVIGGIGVKYKGVSGGNVTYDILCEDVVIRSDIRVPILTAVTVDVSEHYFEVVLTPYYADTVRAQTNINVDAY